MATTTFIFIFFLAVVATIITSTAAKEFQVGGPVGWRTPATKESQLYNVWASRRSFHIGDSLRFRYKNDSVAVVEKWGYYHCDSSNPIAFFNDGDTVINLDDLGTMYFISGDSDRCKKGVNMMLEVMVPGPERYVPPVVSTPPERSYSGLAPSPSQFLGSVDLPESGGGSSSADSVTMVSVSVLGFVTVVVGLGLCLLNA